MNTGMNVKEERNLTMLVDFYELTMGNGYFVNDWNKTAYFDMYFRKVPDGGAFAICAGVQQIIEYISNLHFTGEDVEYLRSKGIFNEMFLAYLENFKFVCDIWAIPEGTPVFPNEPMVVVRGPIIQAQFIETMILLTMNHQTLIATKANRITRSANGRSVFEFGSRRAQGYDGALYGARASYIGGASATACAMAEETFGIPAIGTMAHSWIQSFPDELTAFRVYAKTYPSNCTLLVDTYNVLKSGIPNAIKVFNEEVVPKGFRPKGIRLDSGDMTYLSKEARKMLDEAGFPDCKIVASNSLDEYIIKDLIQQGAKIDSFGVGERLVTAKSDPVFGGVYKLVAIEDEKGLVPKIKISENEAKITNPSFKNIYRLYDKETNKAIGDVLTLADEVIDEAKPYLLFDPVFTWKKKLVENYYARPLLVPIFEKGNCVYESPTVQEIQDKCKEEVKTLWDEMLRLENPAKYYVDLSQNLWDLKQELLQKFSIID